MQIKRQEITKQVCKKLENEQGKFIYLFIYA